MDYKKYIDKTNKELMKCIDNSIFYKTFSKGFNSDSAKYTTANYEKHEIDIDELTNLCKKWNNNEGIKEICFTSKLDAPVKILGKYLCLPRQHKTIYLKKFKEYNDKNLDFGYLFGIPVYDDDKRFFSYLEESYKNKKSK